MRDLCCDRQRSLQFELMGEPFGDSYGMNRSVWANANQQKALAGYRRQQ